MSTTTYPTAVHLDGTPCEKASTTRDCPANHTYVEPGWTPCGWGCGDLSTGHKHFAVLVSENGKTLGRLSPDGTTTRRNIYASVLSFARATEIANEINDNPPFPGITAKRVPF